MESGCFHYYFVLQYGGQTTASLSAWKEKRFLQFPKRKTPRAAALGILLKMPLRSILTPPYGGKHARHSVAALCHATIRRWKRPIFLSRLDIAPLRSAVLWETLR